jgi:hypothetical protein
MPICVAELGHRLDLFRDDYRYFVCKRAAIGEQLDKLRKQSCCRLKQLDFVADFGLGGLQNSLT